MNESQKKTRCFFLHALIAAPAAAADRGADASRLQRASPAHMMTIALADRFVPSKLPSGVGQQHAMQTIDMCNVRCRKPKRQSHAEGLAVATWRGPHQLPLASCGRAAVTTDSILHVCSL